MSFNPYNKSKDGDIINILILFIRKMRPREAKFLPRFISLTIGGTSVMHSGCVMPDPALSPDVIELHRVSCLVPWSRGGDECSPEVTHPRSHDELEEECE